MADDLCRKFGKLYGSSNRNRPDLSWRKGTVNIAGATSATFTINPVSISDAALNYNVVITGTCSNDTSINVFLKVNPVYNINNPQAICNGSSYIFNGHTYTIAGNYEDTLTTINGCDSIIVTQLTVNPIPVAVAGSNSPVCSGSSINLTALTVSEEHVYQRVEVDIHRQLKIQLYFLHRFQMPASIL